MTMMIRPVLPHLYKFDVSNVGVIISAALMLVSTVLVALLVSRYAADRFGSNKKKAALFFTGISFFVALALICFFWMCCNCGQGTYLIPPPRFILL